MGCLFLPVYFPSRTSSEFWPKLARSQFFVENLASSCSYFSYITKIRVLFLDQNIHCSLFADSLEDHAYRIRAKKTYNYHTPNTPTAVLRSLGRLLEFLCTGRMNIAALR